jgi:hypothetical protein
MTASSSFLFSSTATSLFETFDLLNSPSQFLSILDALRPVF